MHTIAPSVQPSLQFQSPSISCLPDGSVEVVHGPEIEGTVSLRQHAPESQTDCLAGDDVDLATCKAIPLVRLI